MNITNEFIKEAIGVLIATSIYLVLPSVSLAFALVCTENPCDVRWIILQQEKKARTLSLYSLCLEEKFMGQMYHQILFWIVFFTNACIQILILLLCSAPFLPHSYSIFSRRKKEELSWNAKYIICMTKAIVCVFLSKEI